MATAAAPTKSQVTKAGKTLRKAFSSLNHVFLADEVLAAYQVLTAFRAAHASPMQAANMGLRSRLRTEECPIEVSQRLKRIPTIIDKLVREPTMALGNMGDIGGVRAVVGSIDEVRRTAVRIQKGRPIAQYHD